MDICGVVLSGGKSSRMGKNKALLEIKGKPAIKHIVEEMKDLSDRLVVVTNHPDDYHFLNLPLISDRYPNKGPLAGIETAMYHEDAAVFIIAACDMPFVSRNIYRILLNKIDGYDAVVPVFENQLHPMSGIYRRTTLPVIQQKIEKDELKVKGFFSGLKVKYVDEFDGINQEQLEKHFFNMNYPSQYLQAKDF